MEAGGDTVHRQTNVSANDAQTLKVKTEYSQKISIWFCAEQIHMCFRGQSVEEITETGQYTWTGAGGTSTNGTSTASKRQPVPMFPSSLSEEPVGVPEVWSSQNFIFSFCILSPVPNLLVIWDSADGSYNVLWSRNDIMQPAKNSNWNISFSEIYEFMQLSDR